jgi:hypothetical protein
MGDFDDGYEAGLWGHDGIPYDRYVGGDDENRDIEAIKKLESIKISLTPTKYLDSDGQYMRAKLINNELSESDVSLEVMHDKYNSHDSKALQVFCNQISIGYIQKYDDEEDIDDFCFIENDKAINLTLRWTDNHFLLSRKLTRAEKVILEKILDEEHRREEEIKAEKNRLLTEELFKEREREKEEKRLAQEARVREKKKQEQREYDDDWIRARTIAIDKEQSTFAFARGGSTYDFTESLNARTEKIYQKMKSFDGEEKEYFDNELKRIYFPSTWQKIKDFFLTVFGWGILIIILIAIFS